MATEMAVLYVCICVVMKIQDAEYHTDECIAPYHD